ncbi:MAG: tRNA pseudouridine(55) synthase TruB [Firmicutes bacterium]|nr:tRNA pseudouridine(55) synthase TruB [Bacillota bacterium]
MRPAAEASGLDGVLVLDKPPGMTSHDVVGALRRLTGQRRAGHTGTLDPAATGVLPICLGQATRAAEYLLAQDKEYRAEVTFGRATDSHDAMGQAVARAGAEGLTAGDLEEALKCFRGVIQQVPPMVSALKVGGKRLYELARQGLEVEREARQVTIHRLQLLEFRPGSEATAILDIACSKGTYIRSLARDLGETLGTGAFLSSLRRTRSGAFRLEDARSLEEVAEAAKQERVGELLLTLDAALSYLPGLTVTETQARALAQGRQPFEMGLGFAGEGLVRLSLPGGILVALAAPGRRGLTTEKVLRHNARF